MEKNILIISGGHTSPSFVREINKNYQFDVTIVVDGGLEVADQCEISIDYLVGDFDSVPKHILEKYKHKIKNKEIPTKLREFQPEKDYTDTHIAIELAVNIDATKIVILGATGTRLDHVLANIHLLMLPLNKNIDTEIIDENNKIYLLDSTRIKEKVILKKDMYGHYVSLIPLTEEVKGVTLEGFKYPLFEKTLTIGESLGVSNEVVDESARIIFTSGILIVIESMD